MEDPGGIFDSDSHRRVLGHLTDEALPLSGPGGHKAHTRSLGHRVSQDPHHGLETVDDLEEVLKDLEADGYASKSKDGWKVTKKGTEALAAPLPEEPDAPVGPVVLEGLTTEGAGGLSG